MATCCCCGMVRPFEEVRDVWYPGVFDRNDYLGDLCDVCADRVGLRDSEEAEEFHNYRIVDRVAFDRIKDSV